MIPLMDLRTGNYIHPAKEGKPDTACYLRIVSISLIDKQVVAKADGATALQTLDHTDIFPCGFEDLMKVTGGLSFGGHAILLQDGMVAIVHENGAAIPLEHIRYVHQFQNLVRSLTNAELPFNITVQD